MMAGELMDDGTMDTVIKCDICGEEARFNFAVQNEFNAAPDETESYDEFVKGCIADFDADHECQMENEDDDNDVIDEETGWGQDTGDPDREDFGSDHGL